jgi:hypothetical protein
MFDSPHPPAFFEPLIDSEHAAALIQVHPQNPATVCQKGYRRRLTRRQTVAIPRFRAYGSPP